MNLSEALIASSFKQVKGAVEHSDISLKRKIEDLRDSKLKLESEHSKVVQEEGLMQESINQVRDQLEAKRDPLAVAQTRLDNRLRRPRTEQTR